MIMEVRNYAVDLNDLNSRNLQKLFDRVQDLQTHETGGGTRSFSLSRAPKSVMRVGVLVPRNFSRQMDRQSSSFPRRAHAGKYMEKGVVEILTTRYGGDLWVRSCGEMHENHDQNDLPESEPLPDVKRADADPQRR